MMPSALENLCGPGKPLRTEPPDAAEFAGLVRSARARLKDAGNPALALESRFDLAYNAAHGLRNLSEYEGGLEIDERVVDDLLSSSHRVAEKITALPSPGP
jgi:hypothetical protein